MLAHALTRGIVLEPNGHWARCSKGACLTTSAHFTTIMQCVWIPIPIHTPRRGGAKNGETSSPRRIEFALSRISHCFTKSITRGPYTLEGYCRVQPAAWPPGPCSPFNLVLRHTPATHIPMTCGIAPCRERGASWFSRVGIHIEHEKVWSISSKMESLLGC